jgi:hypothetical protein
MTECSVLQRQLLEVFRQEIKVLRVMKGRNKGVNNSAGLFLDTETGEGECVLNLPTA